jgi:hypothetical protein
VIDMLKGYLQLAGGMTQLTRQRALEVARQLVAAVPTGGPVPAAMSPEELASRAASLADELLTAGRQNRALLLELVRAEVENVVGRLGLTAQADFEAALATSRARIADLEHELAQRDAELTTARASASRPARAAAKKTTAKKTTAKKTTAKKSTATRAAAKKATAKKATAKKTTAKKTTAKKSTATRAAAKKATAKKSTAKKATARTGS